MTEPTKAEAARALRRRDSLVVANTRDDFERIETPDGLAAAFADAERQVGILAGDAWTRFAHLMEPAYRHTGPRLDAEPDDERDVADDDRERREPDRRSARDRWGRR